MCLPFSALDTWLHLVTLTSPLGQGPRLHHRYTLGSTQKYNLALSPQFYFDSNPTNVGFLRPVLIFASLKIVKNNILANIFYSDNIFDRDTIICLYETNTCTEQDVLKLNKTTVSQNQLCQAYTQLYHTSKVFLDALNGLIKSLQ